MIIKLVNDFFNFFFPTTCIVCNIQGSDICKKCLASFEKAKPSNYEWIFSLWNYRDLNVERVMRHIKNFPNKRVSRICAEKIFEVIARERSSRAESCLSEIKNVIIIPIPIGRARFRSRGYNQSLLLARPLAKLLHRKICTNVLIKSKQTKKQGTTKNKSERLKNISGSFEARNVEKIKNRNIILVDDITTTGTTLFEARKILLEAGAKNVIAVTVAN